MKLYRTKCRIAAALSALAIMLSPLWAQAQSLRLVVTTSFQNSGLSDVLIPAFEAESGVQVDLLVFGTGAALKLAEAGAVDAALVHSPAAERAFVERGFAPYRREIMYNDFVLLGPRDDPASVRAAPTVIEALSRIAASGASFVSRGDDSGTHRKEISLWGGGPQPHGRWYRSTGSGMGATINHAVAIGGYTLSDRGSWLNFGNKGDLDIVFQNAPDLHNQYAFLPVSSERHPHAEFELAQSLEAFLTSTKGQTLIDEFRIAGERAFFANAKPR